MIYWIVFCVILLSMALIVIRFLLGPTIYDRLLSLNNFTNYTIVLVCLIGIFQDVPSYIDIAITYALVSFIINIVLLKHLKVKND